jgi:hypothetical protein
MTDAATPKHSLIAIVQEQNGDFQVLSRILRGILRAAGLSRCQSLLIQRVYTAVVSATSICRNRLCAGEIPTESAGYNSVSHWIKGWYRHLSYFTNMPVPARCCKHWQVRR